VNLVITTLGGNCPVQAEGTVDGTPFYFRARWGSWSLAVGENCVGAAESEDGVWVREREYGDGRYDAGWMSVDEARAFLLEAAAAYVAGESA